MTKEPKIIAFSGAHGTGKTTAVYEKAGELKKSQIKEVGIILETARMCPFPFFSKDNPKTSREAQFWIFSAQIKAELEAARRYGVIVSDRTIVDCIAYTAAAGFYDMAYSMRAMAANYVHDTYREIHFRSILDNDFQIDDGSREMGGTLRQEMELALMSLYAELGVRVIRDKAVVK